MISINWLKDYVDLEGIEIEELANKLTNSGINVEKINSSKLNNLVVGHVIECEKIPDTHLSKCLVDVGSDTRTIVCGAPNVRKGLKVIVSLPGAVLPNGLTIKKGNIRGIESNGMICALSELGLEEDTPENYSKGIHELPEDIQVGEDIVKYYNLDDIVFELDLNPNRSGDCTNQIGFAYEVASVLGKKVVLPNLETKPIEKSVKELLKVSVKTNKCPLYLAKMVTNLEIKDSPDFIRNRLISAGMRPINNIVDISNYVMLEYGQPLHFFDSDKLNGEILVRLANLNEKIITLDHKERNLKESDIVITNGKDPICIAGIMGGANSEVDNNTKNIVIESAIFNGENIRYSSQELDLKSEASVRYERGLNYENTYNAIERACHLLEKYANGTVLKDTIIHDEVLKEERIISFELEDIKLILGIEIAKEEVNNILNNLGFEYKEEKDKYSVNIPNRRLDIGLHKQDIVEEIGRMYGYDNIPSTLPVLAVKEGKYSDKLKIKKQIAKRLRSLGLNEVLTYTLVGEENELFKYDRKSTIELLKPLSSDKKYIRQTIIPSLLKVYEYNKARKEDNVNIYEIANTYYDKNVEETKLAILISGSSINNEWLGLNVKTDFYLLKAYMENLFNYLGLKNRYSIFEADIDGLHPYISCEIVLDREVVGVMGKVSPELVDDDIYVLEVNLNKIMDKKIKPIKYKELSKYPTIVKDVAFVLSKEITNKEVEEIIRRKGSRLLVNIEVFDVYQGEKIEKDQKSIAYSLTFSDPTRTLNDEEVMYLFNEIIDAVKKEFNASIRDK